MKEQPRYLPQLIAEAATYGILRQIYRNDPDLRPSTVDLLREVFRTDRNSRGVKRL
jgi:hypothetical protein